MLKRALDMGKTEGTIQFVRRVLALMLLLLTPLFSVVIAAETEASISTDTSCHIEVGKTRKVTGKLARNTRSANKKQKFSQKNNEGGSDSNATLASAFCFPHIAAVHAVDNRCISETPVCCLPGYYHYIHRLALF